MREDTGKRAKGSNGSGRKTAEAARSCEVVRPTFDLELREMAATSGLIAGVDEAGRGPWAGPVVAAAVILRTDCIPDGIDDSKALDEAKREAVLEVLQRSGALIGVGIVDVETIDRLNILNATFLAMQKAVAALGAQPRLALIDGIGLPRLPCAARAIVGGDASSLSIAAASIVAKVTRDRMLVRIGSELPRYGFERHKGYGTPEHKAALSAYGVTQHHRRSFRPVRVVMGLEQD